MTNAAGCPVLTFPCPENFNLEAKMAMLLNSIQRALPWLMSSNDGAQTKRPLLESLHDEGEGVHPQRGSVACWDGAYH